MKRASTLLLLVSTALPAATPDDFAWQWPLAIGDGELHQLTLTPEIYMAIAHADLRDLALFTKDGRSVAFGPAPTPPDARWRDAPYPLEVVSVHREPRSRTANPALARMQRLTLALRSHASKSAQIRALRISWQHRSSLSGSALWRIVDVRRRKSVPTEVLAHSYSLATGRGETRLALSEFFGDELRLSVAPVPPELEIISVLAEYAPAPERPYRYWRAALEAEPGAEGEYRFALPPALPASAARIDLGNSGVLATIALSVHDREWWREVASDTGFDLAIGVDARQQNRLAFPTTRSARWRLSVRPVIGTPVLEIGYRPDLFLIAHPGPAELVLVAGSARARRLEVPVEPMLRELHAKFGATWSPPQAKLGVRRERSGKAALDSVPEKRSPIIALWTALIVAALTIVLLAVRLLGTPARN